MDVVDDVQQIPEPDAVELSNPEPALQPVQNLFTGSIFPPLVQNYAIGHSHFCQHCQAIRFPVEHLNCCHNGKVQISPLSCYPLELIALFQRQNPNRTQNISWTTYELITAQWLSPPLEHKLLFPQEVDHTASRFMGKSTIEVEAYTHNHRLHQRTVSCMS